MNGGLSLLPRERMSTFEPCQIGPSKGEKERTREKKKERERKKEGERKVKFTVKVIFFKKSFLENIYFCK